MTAVGWAFMLYLIIGLLVGVAFSAKGYRQIDADAANGTVWLRLILFPGAVALWPVVLVKWIRS